MAAPLLFHISSLLVKQAQRERDGALNANGERRFREMDKARSSLRKEYDALTSLAENGLTEQDRQTLREDYAVDIPAMRKEAEKKVDTMAAATLSKKAMAAADGIADQAYDKQIARFNALKPEDAESLLDYEYQLEKITGSILYIKSAQNLARGKSTGPEAEDLRSLDILSASIGSRVNSKTFGMDREVNNDAPQAAPEADNRKDEAEAEAGNGLGPA